MAATECCIEVRTQRQRAPLSVEHCSQQSFLPSGKMEGKTVVSTDRITIRKQKRGQLYGEHRDIDPSNPQFTLETPLPPLVLCFRQASLLLPAAEWSSGVPVGGGAFSDQIPDKRERTTDGRTNQVASPNSKAEGIGSALQCRCSVQVQAAGFRHQCTRCRPVRLRFWRPAESGEHGHSPDSSFSCARQWSLFAFYCFNSSACLSACTGGHCICSFPQLVGVSSNPTTRPQAGHGLALCFLDRAGLS